MKSFVMSCVLMHSNDEVELKIGCIATISEIFNLRHDVFTYDVIWVTLDCMLKLQHQQQQQQMIKE